MDPITVVLYIPEDHPDIEAARAALGMEEHLHRQGMDKHQHVEIIEIRRRSTPGNRPLFVIVGGLVD